MPILIYSVESHILHKVIDLGVVPKYYGLICTVHTKACFQLVNIVSIKGIILSDTLRDLEATYYDNFGNTFGYNGILLDIHVCSFEHNSAHSNCAPKGY